MAILTATEARALHITREQHIEKQVSEWRGEFSATVTNASRGRAGVPGVTCTFFSITAVNSLTMDAKGVFMSEVRAAGYKVRLHDSNDDNDHFVYEIDWSEQK